MSMFGLIGLFSLESHPSAAEVAGRARSHASYLDYKARLEAPSVAALDRVVTDRPGLELRAVGVDAAHAPMLAKGYDRSSRHPALGVEKTKDGLAYSYRSGSDGGRLAEAVARIARDSPDERMRMAAATTYLGDDRPIFVDMGDRIRLTDANPATAVAAIAEMKVHAKLKWGNFVGELRGDPASLAAFDYVVPRVKTFDLASERDAVLASPVGTSALYGRQDVAEHRVVGRSVQAVLAGMDAEAGRPPFDPALARAESAVARAATAAAGREVPASEIRAALDHAARFPDAALDPAAPVRMRDAVMREAAASRILGPKADPRSVAGLAERMHEEFDGALHMPGEGQHASVIRARLAEMRASHASETSRYAGRGQGG